MIPWILIPCILIGCFGDMVREKSTLLNTEMKPFLIVSAN